MSTQKFSSVELGLYSKVLPRASRGFALYASTFIGLDNVLAIREQTVSRLAKRDEDEYVDTEVDEEDRNVSEKKRRELEDKRIKKEKEETEEDYKEDSENTMPVFIQDVKDLVKKIKLPQAQDKLKTALLEEKKKNPELNVSAVIADIKPHMTSKTDVADGVARDICKRYNLSSYDIEKSYAATGEQIKNIINWSRVANGGYDGAIAATAKNQVKKYRDSLRGHSPKEFEDTLITMYYLHKKVVEDQLEKTYQIGSFLERLRMLMNNFGITAHRELVGGATRRPQKTTLDVDVTTDEGEGSSVKETLTEESLGEHRVHDINLEDIEVKELIDNLIKFTVQSEGIPQHEKGMRVFVDEIIADRMWGDSARNLVKNELPTSTAQESMAFAKKLLKANPNYDFNELKDKEKYPTPEAVDNRLMIKAGDYINKTLSPHLKSGAGKYFATFGSPETKVYLQSLVDEMRDHWSKDKITEVLKELHIPRYKKVEQEEYEWDEEKQEHMPVKKTRYKKVSSSLSSRLLMRVASRDRVSLVGRLLMTASESCETGKVLVFEQGRPEFAHEICFERVGSGLSFDVPHDVDTGHLSDVVRVAHATVREKV